MHLRIRDFGGHKVICIEAPVLVTGTSGVRSGLLGILQSDFALRMRRSQSHYVAQLYGLVANGTRDTRHIFKGVKRPLLTDGDMNGDTEILIYSRKPDMNFRWRGCRFSGDVESIKPPPGDVFVVYVTPNKKHRSEFQEIDGWVNHWTWIEEDRALPEAPTDWVSRYLTRVWTRS